MFLIEMSAVDKAKDDKMCKQLHFLNLVNLIKFAKFILSLSRDPRSETPEPESD